MKVDLGKCIGCGLCVPYCGMKAITVRTAERAKQAHIDQDKCVECGVCYRAHICPRDALVMPELEWPRELRRQFSDPVVPFSFSTGMGGRGTEEMKTNDVTGRIPPGKVGVAVELGRPGLGATFRDVEKVTRKLAVYGVRFESDNPVTELMKDCASGDIRPEILEERVLSAIVEFAVDIINLSPILEALKEVSLDIDTVFSLSFASRMIPKDISSIMSCLDAAGIAVRPNAKINVGLGRPICAEHLKNREVMK